MTGDYFILLSKNLFHLCMRESQLKHNCIGRRLIRVTGHVLSKFVAWGTVVWWVAVHLFVLIGNLEAPTEFVMSLWTVVSLCVHWFIWITRCWKESSCLLSCQHRCHPYALWRISTCDCQSAGTGSLSTPPLESLDTDYLDHSYVEVKS